jgi:hypothetical protein
MPNVIKVEDCYELVILTILTMNSEINIKNLKNRKNCTDMFFYL